MDVLRFRVERNLRGAVDSSAVRGALGVAGGTRRAGAIVLVDDEGRLSGIFTDGDLRRLVNNSTDLPATLEEPISDHMTGSPRHLSKDDLVRDAVRLVRELRVDELPVVDERGAPLGLIDIQDLIAMKVVKETGSD